MLKLTPVLVPLLMLVSGPEPGMATGGYTEEAQCEELNVPLCKDADLGYNMTRIPNVLGHQSQDEAGLEVHQFFPLVKVRCSNALQPFLCLIYAPECPDPKIPCRELCQEARDGCESLMNKFGFTWPENLDCAKFPSALAGQTCAVPPGSDIIIQTTTPPTEEPPTTERPADISPPTSTPSTEPADPVCRCEDGTATSSPTDPAALRDALGRFIENSRRAHQLEEETLRMQQENMRQQSQNMQLEKRKLQLEIRLLERQLRRN